MSVATIYYLHHLQAGPLSAFAPHLDRAKQLGFDHVCISPPFRPGEDGDIFYPVAHHQPHPGLEVNGDIDAFLSQLVNMTRERSLRLMIDWPAIRFAADHALVAAHPEAFSFHQTFESPLDPRLVFPAGHAIASTAPDAVDLLESYWQPLVQRWLGAGVAGFRCLDLSASSAALWRRLSSTIRSDTILLVAEVSNPNSQDISELDFSPFDFVVATAQPAALRSGGFVAMHETIRRTGKIIMSPEAPFGPRHAQDATEDRMRLAAGWYAFAAATGSGAFLPAGYEFADRLPMDRVKSSAKDALAWREHEAERLLTAIRETNTRLRHASFNSGGGKLTQLRSAHAQVAAFVRTPSDVRTARSALLIATNTTSEPRIARLPDLAGGAAGDLQPDTSLPSCGPDGQLVLEPHETLVIEARRTPAVRASSRTGRRGAAQAAKSPRVILERLSPAVDDGAYPVKRIVGETVAIEAVAFSDGHETLAVELQWRAADDKSWERVRMTPAVNDRWLAHIRLARLGRHEFRVEAWLDRWAHFHRDLSKKYEAKVDHELDLTEGRALVEQARARADGPLSDQLADKLAQFDAATGDDRVMVLFDEELRLAMMEADDRPFCIRSRAMPIDAERVQAGFASWYELFPRSQTDDPKRHGTFLDVIRQLPRIRDMGFDVLYFTPIHPIGRKNRKGPNNSLTAGPDDPGSPYAIGSEQGGHDAIHPELGTLEDFQTLRRAALEHGLELALDFAIQCSPDHPWLKQHPGWFNWRPDGTIKYAENPPKKYQDIVNVDFYGPDAVPGLWMALRDAVLFWVSQGVTIFRVDNPHTKPLPFWRWMIDDIRRQNPEVIFLSEAFTRPNLMYHLAKIGFSQSYSYFTWRNTKAELTAYLRELNDTAPREFFRPNFFVNTPDINPVYLQTSGRPGFLVRACLAATLGGLWGMYSGFEICEAAPLPGKEEYLDSEKYEIRIRDWHAPQNIVSEIAALNRIRKANPALQSHLGVEFYNAWNDNILYYGRMQAEGQEMILIAVNLDPHHAQACDYELPLWKFNLPDHGALEVEDLMSRAQWIATGKAQHMRLDPAERSFTIWRIRPPEHGQA